MPRTRAPILALVAVTAIWGYTFVPVQKALDAYPLFAFLAVRFAISGLALAPFAWAHAAARCREAGWAAGALAGGLLPTAYTYRAGLDLTTVSSTGFVTGLYVVFTPILALVLSRTPGAPRRRGWGSRCRWSGSALISGDPRWLRRREHHSCSTNAVAQSLQIVAMERFAPRYDARALTFIR